MNDNKDFIYKENELLKRIRELDFKFTDKINTLSSSLDFNQNTFKEVTEKISVNMNSMLESIVANKVKLEQLKELDIFKKKTEDTLVTHEIRINNTIDEMNDMEFKYDKMFTDNFIVPGFVGQSCQFRNLSEYISYNISEVSKIKSEKDYIKKTCNELRTKVNDTVKTLLNLSESIVMRCNLYTDKKKEEFKLLLDEKFEPIEELLKKGNIKNHENGNITIIVEKEKESNKNPNKEKESDLINKNNINLNELKEELIKIIDNRFVKYNQKNDFETKLLQNMENSQFIHHNIDNQINEINEEIKEIKINILQNNNNQIANIENNIISQLTGKNKFKRHSLNSTPSPRTILSNNDNTKKYTPSNFQLKKSPKNKIKQEKIESDRNIKVKSFNNYNKGKNDKNKENFIKKNNFTEQKINNKKKTNVENSEKTIEFTDYSKNLDKNLMKSENQEKYIQNIINEKNFMEKNRIGINTNNSKDYSNNTQTNRDVKKLVKKNLFTSNEDSKSDNNVDSILKNYIIKEDLKEKNKQKTALQNLINPKILDTKILSDMEIKKRNKAIKKKAISDFNSIKYDLKLYSNKTNENEQSDQNKLNDCLTPKISRFHNEQHSKCHVISLRLKKPQNFYEENVNGACVIANKKLMNKHIVKNNDLPSSFESLFNVNISSKKNDKTNYFGKTCSNFYNSKLKKPNINSRNVQTGIKKFVTEIGFK